MWDEKSVYPRIQTGYGYTRDMNDELVREFHTGKITQGGAILKIKYSNPKKINHSTSSCKRRGKKNYSYAKWLYYKHFDVR